MPIACDNNVMFQFIDKTTSCVTYASPRLRCIRPGPVYNAIYFNITFRIISVRVRINLD